METLIKIEGPNLKYSEEYIESQYPYHSSEVSLENGTYKVKPSTTHFTFRTERKVPKLGVMLVGWGGNNGTTVTAAVLANKLGMTWRTKTGVQNANYLGSLLQSSTVCLGTGPQGDVYVPFGRLLPMVHPNDIVFDGWDISSMDLAAAMERAQVLDWSLQEQLRPHMEKLKPRPSIYFPKFIAANQEERADNVIQGTQQEQLEQVRRDIRDFKQKSGVDKVVVLWTANTERFCDIIAGVHDTAHNLLKAIEDSLLASPLILDLVILTELCQRISFCTESQPEFQGFHSVLSILSYLCKAPLVPEGTPPTSIVSYNHLGNNDGMNLSAPQQFRSKEISKSNVVDDMVKSNPVLYRPDEKPDHCVSAGDSTALGACLGLPPQNHMLLEHKMQRSSQCSKPGVTDAVSKKLSALSNGHVQNGLVKLHGH
ncbi:Inositol-3-phosphate synthase 1-A [Acipenser ruthenus]|uniref:inositol-3-phosphate synthase n=1 Tax=Acipenser ruthenus TaxID=7906 RepID=A0A444V7B9_ACIRT|nr:Inositol-3-phosphate synthase 1-A [Acipenser ruthenus]